jgi:hypothetical protein
MSLNTSDKTDYKQYSFSFNELAIKPENIEKAMGNTPGTTPNPYPEIIQKVLSAAADYCNIEGGYRIIDDIEINQEKKQIRAGKARFDTKQIVTQQIRKSEQLAFFLCTAGKKICNWSKKLFDEGDLMTGFVVDTVGSIVVDSAMDCIQQKLKKEMAAAGLNITNRYSPGYCGWDVSDQFQLFSLFPENFCGITLTDTALMNPIKSVSGVIGIGKNVRFNQYTCNLCDDTNCLYRNLGK